MNRYTSTAKLFHWSMALIVIVLLGVGFIMTGLEPGPFKFEVLYFYHKSFGALILLLAFLRLVWRLTHTPPAFDTSMPLWEKLLSRMTHYSLYLLLFLMPLSGIMMSVFAHYPISVFNIFHIQPFLPKDPLKAHFLKETHEFIGITLAILIGLHTTGALYHLFLKRDKVFQRMWFLNSSKEQNDI